MLAKIISTLLAAVVVASSAYAQPWDDVTLTVADSVPQYGEFSSTAGRIAYQGACWTIQANDPSHTAVILVLGQSQAGNSPITPPDENTIFFTNLPTALNFNIYDGLCYEATDPMLGASGSGGSVWSRLAWHLIETGIFTNVIVVPIAVGGTHVADWLPSGLAYHKVLVAGRRLQDAGLSITHIIWTQGAQDSEPFYGSTSFTWQYMATKYAAATAAYRNNLLGVVNIFRSRNIGAPFYVSQDTLCSGGVVSPENYVGASYGQTETDNPFVGIQQLADRNTAMIYEIYRSAFRRTQLDMADPALNIRHGVDWDMYGQFFRADGCHIDAYAMAAIAWDMTYWMDWSY